MQLSAFHLDRANRLPEQTQRRVYGGTARAPRRGGGIVKIFHWEFCPNENLTQLLLHPSYTPIDHSKYSIYLQQRDPLLLIQYNSIYTIQHLYTAKPYLVGERPEPFKFIYL